MGSVVKKVGSGIAGAVGGAMSGGPWGALTGGLGGLFGGGGGDQTANVMGSPDMTNILGSLGVMNPNAQQGGGGGFMDWLKKNGNTIGNAGLLGATMLGKGNPLSGLQSALGGLINPRAINDPRVNATNDFSSLLSGAMAGGGNIGEMLAKLGMGPAYGGQLNAGATQGQTDALGSANSALAQWFGGGAGAGAMDNLNSIAGSGNSLNLPPEIAAMLGSGSQGGSLMDQIQSMIGGNQNQSIQSLLGLGGGTPEQTMLQQLAGSGNNPFIQQLASLGGQQGGGAGGNALAQLFSSPQAAGLLGGGQGSDLQSIGSAIQAASQPGLDRNVRDLREQFSFNGLRNSTDLNAGVAQLMSENQSGLQGILAQIAPQIAQNQNQTSLGALNSLSGIGGQLGQLDQSSLASRIAAMTGASGAQNTQLGTLGGILGQAGNLGLGGQQNQISATGQSGQLQNQQLQTMLQGLIGGQGAQTGQADILARLFGGQQQNATQAALAQPGATNMMAQLPQLLAQMNLGMNTGMQNQGQNDLTRQYQAWQAQQSLTPQLLQFLQSAGAQQFSPSLLNTGMNLGLGGAAIKQTK